MIGAKFNRTPDSFLELKKILSKKYEALVGIFPENNQRSDGKSNAEIGLQHEYGDSSLVSRSWLRMPIRLKQTEITQAAAEALPKAIAEKDMSSVYTALAKSAEKVIEGAFDSGGYGKWAPLSDTTVALKGNDKILVDTAELKNAVSSKVV